MGLAFEARVYGPVITLQSLKSIALAVLSDINTGNGDGLFGVNLLMISQFHKLS
uniref:Uncharacterized protein n=1 Tax=uncultured marine virus TaxID=186617 RepID=A0A0F7L4S7_9VIRU|nr:hypothetical protein [uncultured marine virus]